MTANHVEHGIATFLTTDSALPQPRPSRGPRLRFFRRVGEALATESTAESLAEGAVVGRIFKVNAAPIGMP
jgi:hypothetical protein